MPFNADTNGSRPTSIMEQSLLSMFQMSCGVDMSLLFGAVVKQYY